MDTKRSETWFFIVLLAIALALSWLILSPYGGVLVLAGTLAFLFQPLYKKLLHVFRYESLTAFVMVLIIALLVFVPVGFFGVRIFVEATSLYGTLASHGGFDFGTALTKFLHNTFSNLQIPAINLNFNDYFQQGLNLALQNFGPFFSGVGQILFMSFLSLLGLFYFLKDGERLKKWLFEIIPLPVKYTEEILREMEAVGNSVVKGTLVVAIVQGVLMGVGLYLFHVPNPAFWGALVVPASIIPMIGTWLVMVPAAIYLFFTGQVALGVGLLIWSLVFIVLVYNVLLPQLMHHHVHVPPYLILLGVFGGLGLFGPIGLLMGPLVMAFLLSLLRIYPRLIGKSAGTLSPGKPDES